MNPRARRLRRQRRKPKIVFRRFDRSLQKLALANIECEGCSFVSAVSQIQLKQALLAYRLRRLSGASQISYVSLKEWLSHDRAAQ